MTPALDFTLAATIVAAAGILRGFAGFGGGLVMSPALSLLFGPTAAVASISLIDLPALLYLLPESWRHGDWRSVVPLGLAGVCMVPLGAWTLIHLDPELLRRSIGLLVVAFVVILAVGWRYRGAAGLPLTLGVDGTGGFLGGAMGIPGPPIILFYLSGPAAARPARASIMSFFLFTGATTMLTYGFNGLYTRDVLVLAASLLPAYLGGVWLGNRLFGHVSEVTFRRASLIVLAGIGIAALVT